MENITAQYNEKTGELTLKIDTRRKGVPSKTGQNIVIATTRGNVSYGDFKLGVNVYRENPDFVPGNK